MRDGDHLVALADVERVGEQPQAVGAVADADRVRGAGEPREVLLEVDQLLAQHEVAAGEGVFDDRQQLRPLPPPLLG